MVTIIGEYSTGKTAFINHILGLTNNSQKLDTGLAPTTDCYQLILTRKTGNRVREESPLPTEFAFLNKYNEAMLNPTKAIFIKTLAIDNQIAIMDTPGVISGYGNRKKFVGAVLELVKYSSLVIFMFASDKAQPLPETIDLYQKILSSKKHTTVETVLNKVASATSAIDLAQLYGQLVRHIVTARDRTGINTAEVPKVKFIDYPGEERVNRLGIDFNKLNTDQLVEEISMLSELYMQKVEQTFQDDLNVLIFQIRLLKEMLIEKFEKKIPFVLIFMGTMLLLIINFLYYLDLLRWQFLFASLFLLLLYVFISFLPFPIEFYLDTIPCEVNDSTRFSKHISDFMRIFSESHLSQSSVRMEVYNQFEEICTAVIGESGKYKLYIDRLTKVKDLLEEEKLEHSQELLNFFRSKRINGFQGSFSDVKCFSNILGSIF